jgi:hypothetical protein
MTVLCMLLELKIIGRKLLFVTFFILKFNFKGIGLIIMISKSLVLAMMNCMILDQTDF